LKPSRLFEKGLNYDIDADLAWKAEPFADCLLSDVARNLIGIFLNTRAAGRLPRIEGLNPAAIRRWPCWAAGSWAPASCTCC